MPNISVVFVRWVTMRAVLHRGYWLVTSLYLVIDADLSAFQLVFLGTAQAIVSLVVEVPAGVVADTVSRKLALVIAHALVGLSMTITGLVTAFPALVATQMVWGVGWAFASGADVAWVTDELDRPDRIARVLAAAARWELVGSASGLVGCALLAVAIGRGPAMVATGAGMVALGLYVLARFSEQGFVPVRRRHWQRSRTILRRGVGLARRDREILLVLVATVLINGAAEAYGRLYPKRLVDLGFPGHADLLIWFTGLGITAYAVGTVALRVVEERIDDAGAAPRAYAAACAIGVLGLLALAIAPGFLVGSAGVLLIGGVALTVTRAVGVIWVNRRATSDVRATVQSMLAQAEYGGEILFGVALGAVAQSTTIATAFVWSAAIIGTAGAMMARSRSS